MTHSISQTLAALADAIGRLPKDAQADVLAELDERAMNLRTSALTEEQRIILRERLAAPREYATREEVESVLRRYSRTL